MNFRNKLLFASLLLVFSFQFGLAQEQEYKVALVGFYNFENLFDTLDTPNKRDSDFTPNGDYAYDSKIYQEKLHNLSTVVSSVGTEISPDGLAILGICEVENRSVLDDFVGQQQIAARDYQIIHYESPDRRGIDNALIYNPKYFSVESSRNIAFGFPAIVDSNYRTRDILYVHGKLDGEDIHVFVNHWPSRSGGEGKTAPLRNHAASVCRGMIDSLQNIDPSTKIIVMGDLNDDPSNKSVKEIIRAKLKRDKMKSGDMYNPFYAFYKKGIGTNAYRDAWSNFDQLIFSRGFLSDPDGFIFLKAKIFKEPYMLQKSGQYKGYPKRTYGFGVYMGGYSDHFPVYSILVKPID